MPGYLIDNNHLTALFNRVPMVVDKVEALPPGSQLRACVITLGEVEAGHRMTTTTNQARRDEYTAWINEQFLPNVIPVSANTRLYYADIIGRIWRAHPPAHFRIGTEEHLVKLGVDVNDVWAAAVAWEHGLILVTRDRMECIREALKADVQLESWL